MHSPVKHTTVALSLSIAFHLMPASSASADWVQCVPVHVAQESDDRLTVRCATPINFGGAVVEYLAISARDAGRADRFVTFATTALLSGSFFMADIVADVSTNTPGCLAIDCRTPRAFGVKRR